MGLVQKSFSDIITFSRSSNATRVGPTGVLEYAPHNLLTYSQDFSNASWDKGSGYTLTANAIAAPDGTVTADLFIRGSTLSYAWLSQTVVGNASQPITFSCWVRTVSGASSIALVISDVALASAGSSYLSIDATWKRLSFSITAGQLSNTGAIGVGFTMTSGQSAYFWGAQLAVGPYALDYTPTTSAAVYGPRFDYDPVTLAARGLLVEEQRTNTCTYSEDITAVAWKVDSATRTSNAATSPDGTVNADSVTYTASTGKLIRENAYQISVSGSTTYTISVWLRVTSGTFKLKLSRTNGATWATATLSPELTVTTTWQRFTLTYTSDAGDTLTDIVLGSEDKTPYTLPATGTVLVWGFQHEAGSFATSYIPTVASTVTRSADVASVNTLSPWFNATEGTLFTEFNAYTGVSYSNPASLFTNASNQVSIVAGTAESGATGLVVISGGSVLVNIGTRVLSQKIAGAYKLNDFAVSTNGAAADTDTSGTVPSISTLGLGSAYSSAYLNGHLRRVAYYPRRLTNAELQALTA